MSQPTLAIIPALNEVACIGQTVREVLTALPNVQVLVIDDGSVDDTGATATQAGALVVRHAMRLGVAAAESTGLEYARRHGFTRVIRLDADGQHDPGSAGALLKQLDEGVDLVIGSRFLGTDGSASTPLRRLGGGLLAKLLTMASGLPVTDPTSGYRAFSAKAIDVLSRAQLHGYPEPESILLAARRGLSLREVSVTMRPRAGGTSSLTPLASAFYMVKVCFALTIELMRPR